MNTIEQITDNYQALQKKQTEISSYMQLHEKQERIDELRDATQSPDFWQDPNKAQLVTREISILEFELERWQKVQTLIDDIELYFMMKSEGENINLNELAAICSQAEDLMTTIETEKLLSGEDDNRNAILVIHPGAGGTESQDWANMLFRLYSRWLERKGYDYTVVNYQPGEEAGIKEAVIEVIGPYAYGYLSTEIGVHRLVRISPFDANARRHTSFASVFVYPVFEELGDIEINTNDLRIDTYRASGAGGQHVNKTDSAVRITHLPTGIVVSCQNERSQHKNKDTAMKLLASRLHQKQLEEERAKRDAINSTKKEIAWGSQIRSYVFQPYTLVKDTRTGYETGNIQAVMDGDIDGFIKSFLAKRQSL
ncbi:MAG TPA: peptide chain release factor 2 [Candidatus Marinimicrobia bacterium]|nr:peptide chain release factor 2 [Candidatus Neomarinimicrobiota bacterium]